MKLPKTISLILAAICITSIGCSDSSVADPVIQVDEANAEMNEAMETALKTFPQFLENWKTFPSDALGIKFALKTRNDQLEHIWFEPTEITDTKVTGICSNDPANVEGLKYGDARTFDRSELTDWMIIAGEKCYGGYTIRVLAKMDPDNAPPLKFVDF